ncbi:proline-rich receptor-like protein kinase PERK1 [Cynara cardunculus var. scolymus]|uniref:proline-rich receptor-like protein kinase PERK1 n=1 Tax=Cynara cardunculus var. scolymus TaxID=59895 RepID=UPI000D62CBBB|nr:proline-rich receptor-like protein kinase PERK1 [Cynara cardunculus var. scolymus]
MSSPPPGTSPAPTAPATPPPTTTTTPPPAASAPPPSTPASPPPASTPPPSTPASPPPVVPTPPTPVSSPPPPNTPAPSTSPPAPPTTTSPPPSTPTGPSPPSPSGSTPTNPPPPTPRNSPPSPPGRTTPSPPPPRSVSSSPPAAPSSNSSSGISTGAVVGIAIGGVLILAVLSIFFICCKKKKRRSYGPADFYVPPPPPPKVDPYGGQPQQWQHNAPPPGDHVVMMPPLKPPPPMAARPPQSPVRSPPPRPPFMSSSGGSGSNYSGGSDLHPPPAPVLSLGFSKSTFTYEELAMATDGFSDANLLGQGGFGYVHKGVLPNGKEVAVKSLKAGSGQGEREFQAEVEIISRVHHKHLVSLVGYCISGAQRMLVYEFVPNNTMEFHLHGKNRPVMEFSTRLRIALGSAKGLAYLHEDCHPKIIHRDIKAANILLEFNFEAKVADFGLAKITSDVATHVSTRVMGTFGYLAPEYAASGKLSEKSDVFSYGVMLLELITGRRPVDSANTFMDDSLVDWARPLLTRALEDGNFDAIVDSRLQKDYNPSEMARMVSCAAVCVRHSARRRPKMSQVVRALEGDVSLSDLDEGIRPGHSSVYTSHGSSDYDTTEYNKDMIKFRKMALGTQEYASSEYSRPTSEYGLNPSGSSSEGQNTREMEMSKLKKDSRGFSDGF